MSRTSWYHLQPVQTGNLPEPFRATGCALFRNTSACLTIHGHWESYQCTEITPLKSSSGAGWRQNASNTVNRSDIYGFFAIYFPKVERKIDAFYPRRGATALPIGLGVPLRPKPPAVDHRHRPKTPFIGHFESILATATKKLDPFARPSNLNS